MRASPFHSIALMLEENSRSMSETGTNGENQLTITQSLLRVLIEKALTEKLPATLKLLSYSPIIVLVAIILLYIVFLIVFTPLWVISWFATWYGSHLLLLVLFHFLVVYVARNVAFIGGSHSTQRQWSSEVIRRIIVYIDNVSQSSSDVSSFLLLLSSNRAVSNEINLSSMHFKELTYGVYSLSKIYRNLNNAYVYLKRENALTIDECRVIDQLFRSCQDFENSYHSMLYSLSGCTFLSRNDHYLVNRLIQTKGTISNAPIEPLVTSAAKCLSAGENLRKALSILSSEGNGDEDRNGASSILPIINMIFSFTQSMNGYEKLAFPYLRSILYEKYSGKPIRIKGSNDNSIDAIYIKASSYNPPDERKNDRSQNHSALNDTISIKKVVLFCGPNAGYYEGVAQALQYQNSWFSFYLSSGYDIFLFNYRGYGRSTGYPTPHGLKSDALNVVNYIRKEITPDLLLVHGESIGGMIASHIAKMCDIDALVCDRTFACLDATASRLMGQWAGSSLKYCSGWNTDVVSDYLHSNIPKLIVQDPRDEIIIYPSSLQNGVATKLVLQTNNFISQIPTEPSQYKYERYIQSNNIFRQEYAMNWWKDDKGTIFDNEQGKQEVDAKIVAMEEIWLQHFYACCQFIGSKASQYQRAHRDKPSAAHSPFHNKQEHNNHENEATGREESILIEMITIDNESEFKSKHDVESALAFSTGSIREGKIYSDAWNNIARIRGCGNALLGQSIATSMDETFAWICSYSLWYEPTTLGLERQSNPNFETKELSEVVLFLQELIEQESSANSAFEINTHCIAYVIKMLKLLHTQNSLWCKHRKELNAALKECRGFNSRQGSEEGNETLSASPLPKKESQLSKPSNCCNLFGGNSADYNGRTVQIGQLLSVKCGHNNPLSSAEMEVFAMWMKTHNL